MTLKTLPVNFDKKLLTPDNKCSFCIGSVCCSYVTQHIETPRSKSDYTHLLWQVSHEHVKIYKDEDGWTLLIEGRCLHLQPDNRCGIYENRPAICREHSNDYCEFDAPAEDGFDLYFPTYDSLLKYCNKKFKNWNGIKSDKKLKKNGKKKSAKKSKDKKSK